VVEDEVVSPIQPQQLTGVAHWLFVTSIGIGGSRAQWHFGALYWN
jgi:hypothetical protein